MEEYAGITSFRRFFPAVLIKFFFLCVYVCIFFHLELVKHMYVQEKLKVAVLSYVFATGSVVTWGKLLNSLCLNCYDNSFLPQCCEAGRLHVV